MNWNTQKFKYFEVTNFRIFGCDTPQAETDGFGFLNLKGK